MWPSEQKPATFVYKLKFILLFQLIATLNNYTCLLPPLANFNWYVSPECFIRPCKSMAGEMAPMEVSNLAVGTWYCSHCQSIGLVVEYLPFVGACGRHSHSKPYQYVILLLCFNLCHHPHHPCVPPAHQVIYTGPMLMNSMKKIVTSYSKSQPLSTCHIIN